MTRTYILACVMLAYVAVDDRRLPVMQVCYAAEDVDADPSLLSNAQLACHPMVAKVSSRHVLHHNNEGLVHLYNARTRDVRHSHLSCSGGSHHPLTLVTSPPALWIYSGLHEELPGGSGVEIK